MVHDLAIGAYHDQRALGRQRQDVMVEILDEGGAAGGALPAWSDAQEVAADFNPGIDLGRGQ
ncbi:hypothetical protein D3C78_1652200 [compost metagenome]